MKGILRYLSGAAVAMALLLAGSGTAHAQNWPTTFSNLRCNWTLSSGGMVTGGGTSTIRFSLGPVVSDNTGIYRTGTLTTTLNGTATTKPIKVIWDWSASHEDTFIFKQTQDNITCDWTRTFDYGSVVVFDGCSNGAFQYCR